jgi:hypothetical protein
MNLLFSERSSNCPHTLFYTCSIHTHTKKIWKYWFAPDSLLIHKMLDFLLWLSLWTLRPFKPQLSLTFSFIVASLLLAQRLGLVCSQQMILNEDESMNERMVSPADQFCSLLWWFWSLHFQPLHWAPHLPICLKGSDSNLSSLGEWLESEALYRLSLSLITNSLQASNYYPTLQTRIPRVPEGNIYTNT